jgi:hypothetical protein
MLAVRCSFRRHGPVEIAVDGSRQEIGIGRGNAAHHSARGDVDA